MSGYIGTQPVPQATQTRDTFTATSGQTSFATSGYTPNYLDVFLNGVKLAAADYTASNGSDVVLAVGATTGDILEVVAYTTFEISGVTGLTPSITDNGNATAITIDSSERVLVGKTTTGLGNKGAELDPEGQLKATSNGVVTMYLNRQTSDGTIAEFRKDNTTVGSIGVSGSELFIGSTSGTDSYLGFGSDILKPVTSTGAARSGAINLGNANAKWKDLYLSGGVYLGGTGAANYLSDYETGTWTLGVTIGGSAQTLSGPVATYTKVGNTVSIRMRVGFSKSGSGVVNITGLPFASSFGSTVSVPIGCQVGSVTSTAALFANIDSATTIVHLADQAGDLTDADFASTAYVFSSFTYQAG